jgi:hypothetical protein
VPREADRRLGWAWIGLTIALFVHVLDETLTNFLVVYNPTAIALRERIPWLPLPVFQFEIWLAGLVAAVFAMAVATPLAFRNVRSFRPVMWLLAVFMLLKGLGHIAGTIAGRTPSGMTFSRPMPGTYSSPLLIGASLYLIHALRESATSRQRLRGAAREARA